jgi:hypothetical protein
LEAENPDQLLDKTAYLVSTKIFGNKLEARRRRRRRKGRPRFSYFKDVDSGLREMKAKSGD